MTSIKRTADVVLFSTNQDGDTVVLLIERKYEPFKGRWALPGGHIDPGESPVGAAARELREETGIELDAEFLRKVSEYNAPGRDPRGDYHTYAFTATLTHPVSPRAGDDAAQAQWIKLPNGCEGDLSSQAFLTGLAFDHFSIVRDAVIEMRRVNGAELLEALEFEG